MWAVDETGAFSFSDATDPGQTVLFRPEPGRDLALILHERFRGTRVIYEKVEQFVDENTIYVPTHTKKALQMLEAGQLGPQFRVAAEELKRDGKKRRRPYFTEGTFIRFETT